MVDFLLVDLLQALVASHYGFFKHRNFLHLRHLENLLFDHIGVQACHEWIGFTLLHLQFYIDFMQLNSQERGIIYLVNQALLSFQLLHILCVPKVLRCPIIDHAFGVNFILWVYVIAEILFGEFAKLGQISVTNRIWWGGQWAWIFLVWFLRLLMTLFCFGHR